MVAIFACEIRAADCAAAPAHRARPKRNPAGRGRSPLMSVSRVRQWSADPPEDTVQQISEKLETRFEKVVFTGGLKYPSDDFKTGIDTARLAELDEYLDGFLELDPRGGYIGQTDLKSAVMSFASKDKYVGAFLHMYAELGHQSLASAVSAFAYTTRVMLSHVRIRYEKTADKTQAPSVWQRLFNLITDHQQLPTPTKPNDKNPFVAFRPRSLDNVDGPEQEEV